ncbi:MAG: hypothetical protein NC388_05055 [Clostridium sp.]|nr:hypothetical protein [Clostridium sp.]
MRGLFYLYLLMFTLGFVSCTESGTGEGALYARVDSLLTDGALCEERKDVRQALICYWEALDLLEQWPDSVQRVNACQRLGDLLFRCGLYEKAVVHHREGYDMACRMADDRLLYESMRKLALDYSLLHRADTADYFRRQSRAVAARMGLDAEDVHEAMPASVEMDYADSITTLHDRERILNWESKYRRQKALCLAEQQRVEALERWAGLFALLFVVSAVWFAAYRHKQKEAERKEKQLRWYNRLLEDIRGELAGHQTELFIGRQRISELQQELANNHASVEENEKLREELRYYMRRETDISGRERVLRERETALLSADSLRAVTLLSRMKSAPVYCPVKTEEEWQALASFAEFLYPGYRGEMAAVAELTERERRLHLLMRLGFSTGQLAIFEGISPGSVTKAKFRLQKKIESAQRSDVRMAE